MTDVPSLTTLKETARRAASALSHAIEEWADDEELGFSSARCVHCGLAILVSRARWVDDGGVGYRGSAFARRCGEVLLEILERTGTVPDNPPTRKEDRTMAMTDEEKRAAKALKERERRARKKAEIEAAKPAAKKAAKPKADKSTNGDGSVELSAKQRSARCVVPNCANPMYSTTNGRRSGSGGACRQHANDWKRERDAAITAGKKPPITLLERYGKK